MKLVFITLIFCIFLNIVKAQRSNNNSKWQPFVSFINAHPDFSKTTYNLNNQLDVRFFNDDLWSCHQAEAGVYLKTGKTNTIKISLGYSNTEQYGQLINNLSDQDLIDFGEPSFELVRFTYVHERLQLQMGMRQYIFRGFFAEPAFSAALNISGKHHSDFLTYLAAREVYEPLFNGAKNLNNIILFGSLNIGYEYKGFFASYFHEISLSPINHQFNFRGSNYNLRYPQWINRGIRVGYIFDLNKVGEKSLQKN